MKKGLIYMITLILVTATAGCSTTKFWYAPGDGSPNSRGKRLNSFFGKGPEVQTIIINKSGQPIFVDLDGRTLDFFENFIQVNPGDSLIRQGRTFHRIKVTIAWWAKGIQDVVGYTEEKVYFSVPGLYTGEPIMVDDLFLRDKTLQKGVVVNYSPEAIRVWDSQGTEYGVLEPGQSSSITELVPVFTTFYWLPESQVWYQYEPLSWSIDIDKKENVYWHGQPIGWQLIIRRGRDR